MLIMIVPLANIIKKIGDQNENSPVSCRCYLSFDSGFSLYSRRGSHYICDRNNERHDFHGNRLNDCGLVNSRNGKKTINPSSFLDLLQQ